MEEYEVHIRVRIKAEKEDLDDCADIIVNEIRCDGWDSFETVSAEWDRATPVSS